MLCLPLAAQDLQVPDALRPAWDRLAARHPLPPGVRSGSVVVSDADAPGFRAIESTVQAAVVRLWEPQPGLSAAQARAGMTSPTAAIHRIRPGGSGDGRDSNQRRSPSSSPVMPA